jgi:hypothetical protein
VRRISPPAAAAAHKVGPGFDAVRHHAVGCAVQTFNPLNADHVGARTGYAGAHGHQTVRQIDHFGFARRVLDDRLAFGQCSRHHQVFGPGHGHHVGEQAGAAQT